MALNANAIVDIAEAMAFIREKAEPAALERKINSLSGNFERVSCRKIKLQTVTDYRVDGSGSSSLLDYRDGRSSSSLLLPFVPCQSVSKIEIRYRDESVYKIFTSAADFVLKDKNVGLLTLINDFFPRGERNILLTMSVGYLATDMEFAAFQEAFLTQLKFDYRKWDHDEVGLSSRALADGSIQFMGGQFATVKTHFLREVQDLLDLYRDRRFA